MFMPLSAPAIVAFVNNSISSVPPISLHLSPNASSGLDEHETRKVKARTMASQFSRLFFAIGMIFSFSIVVSPNVPVQRRRDSAVR